MSLKAQLKGQQGCDLFWSAATREASGTNENFESTVLLRKSSGILNKTSEAVPGGLLQIGKLRGTRTSPGSTKREGNGAKEKKWIKKRDNCLNKKRRCCCTNV